MPRTSPPRPRLRTLAVVVTALAVLAPACGGDGDEPAAAPTTAAPTTTEKPTTTSTTEADEPTPTTEGDDPEPEPEEPEERTAEDYDYVLTETFDEDEWVTGCNDQGCAGIEDGHFYEDIYANQKEIDQHVDWSEIDFYDVGVQVDVVSWGAGSPQAGVACFADPDADTYYDLTVSADGIASIYRFEDGVGEALLEETEVDGWDRESPATLTTGCTETDDGVSLLLEVDGEQVGSVLDDDPLPAGQVGLITYGDAADLSTVWYDDMSVVGDHE